MSDHQSETAVDFSGELHDQDGRVIVRGLTGELTEAKADGSFEVGLSEIVAMRTINFKPLTLVTDDGQRGMIDVSSHRLDRDPTDVNPTAHGISARFNVTEPGTLFDE